jgi:hypothetical protein
VLARRRYVSSKAAASSSLPRHEVAVAVEGDRDGGVAHVGRECLRIDASGDHEARERVPRFVERDRFHPDSTPGGFRSGVDRGTVERLAVWPAEDMALDAGAAVPVLDEVVTQDRWDRDSPASRARLRLDRPFLDIPRSLDADDAVGEVDIVPAKRLELAATEAAVEGSRPQRAVALGKRGEERFGSFW